MLKGINRQMIEIVQPDNPYFEKAFLVVRAGTEDTPPASWQSLTADLLAKTDGYSGLRRARARLYRLAACCGGAGLLFGALLGLLIGRYI